MAADGAKALVLAEALRPRVLVLNAELPSLDGVSLLRELDAVWNAEVTIMLSTSGARSVLNAAQAAVARRFETSAACVERSIRHAVEELWSHSDAEELHRIFGAAVDPKRGKPTNSAFLAVLSERLALEAEKRGG